MRCLLAALYLAIPNFEVHANITNAQWHLAILGFMVIVAIPSRRWWWRLLDLSVLVLCGLSGPFVILLAPIALACWVARRGRWALVVTAVTSGIGLLQGLTALASLGDRPAGPLGAGPRVLGDVVVNRVLLSGLLGQQGTSATISAGWSHGTVITAVLAAAATVTVVLAFWRGPLELRLLLAFGVMVLALSLAKPMVDPVQPQWRQIALGGGTGTSSSPCSPGWSPWRGSAHGLPGGWRWPSPGPFFSCSRPETRVTGATPRSPTCIPRRRRRGWARLRPGRR